MTEPMPENIDAAASTEEEFRPSEEVRLLRQELTERLAALAEKYTATQETTETTETIETTEVPAEEIYVSVRSTFQEHLEAATLAISQLQRQNTQPDFPRQTIAAEPLETAVNTALEETETTKKSPPQSVLEIMNSVLTAVGVLGFLWIMMLYLRGDDVSQVGVPLIAAGLGLIAIGISGRLIQNHINRPNWTVLSQ
ncbi:MAG: hypothetical protein FWE67_08360 [Planctomycetaceae bacterium]|nr:hypothetical protein [Planctomycetaceae bacterium]